MGLEPKTKLLPCPQKQPIENRLNSQSPREKRNGREMGRKAKVEFDEGPPDDFDPNNPYKDPVAMLEMREYLVREKWIQIETAKILAEKLRWCYRIEGVNHLQKCKHLVHQYLDSTRGIGWGKDHRPVWMHGPKEEQAAAANEEE